MIDINATFRFNNEISFNCSDMVITSILQWYKVNWQIIFINSWGFSINPNVNGRLGDKISCMSRNTEYSLKEFLGVEVIEKKVSAENALGIIRNETKCKRPVILNTDVYWCHWTKIYKKVHDVHSVVVTEIDDENNIYCMDGTIWHFHKKSVLMKFEDFKGGYNSVSLLQFSNKPNNFNWRKVLSNALYCTIYKIESFNFYKKRNNMLERLLYATWLKSIKRVQRKTMFSDLEIFAGELAKLKGLENERVNEESILECPLLIIIRDLANGRRKFAITLKYLGEQFRIDGLLEFSKRIDAIGWDWEEVKYLLFEAYENNDSSRIKKSSDLLINITKKEKSLAFEMLKFCTGY